jgi:hypothetical protein
VLVARLRAIGSAPQDIATVLAGGSMTGLSSTVPGRHSHVRPAIRQAPDGRM